MHICAYCGRRLLWLHRVVDGYRYCCREHARLHRPAREEAARKRGGAAEEKPPVESLLECPEESDQEPGSAAASPESPFPEAPLQGFSDRLVRLDASPVDFRPARSGAITPVPEDLGAAGPVVRVIVIPGREPAFPAPHAGLVPPPLAPVAADRRTPAAIRPLRPRRTVLAPAHRPAAPPTGLREGGAVVPASWLTPAGEWLRRSSGEEASAPSSSPQEPNSVLVFSFLEGGQTSAGSAQAARPFLRQRARQSCGALMNVPAAPLEWSAATLAGPLLLIRARSGRRPPAVLGKPRPAGVIPRLRVRTGAPAVAKVLEEQTAPVQPFRVLRMPMRRLRLRPVSSAEPYPPRCLPVLSRLLFLNALHVPRAASMPCRPAYRLLPPPAALAGPAQPRGDLAGYAANRSQGE